MKLAVLPLLFMLAAPDMARSAPGVMQVIDNAERPLALSIWYPAEADASITIGANAVFEGAPAATDAPVPSGRLPLIVLSHGGLRSAANSGAWLAAAMAQAGFLVVEVNGPRPENPRQAVDEIWRRPDDIRDALDLVLGDPVWSDRVERDRIAVAGFALGGTAALSVAGRRLDPDGYLGSCSGDDAGHPDCAWFAAHDVAPEQVDRDRLDRSRRDLRIGAAVALDPEYASAFAGDAASDAAPALLILSDKQNSIAGNGIQELPQAGPFDAFPVCTAKGARILLEDGGDPALCGASPEARRQAHDRIAKAIIAFLNGARD